jgi:hypothetical protein
LAAKSKCGFDPETALQVHQAMKRNETITQSNVNLFPNTALTFLTLLGVIVGLVMLWGLHNKVPKQEQQEMMTIVSADEIGEIKLDKNFVRINLMGRTESGGIEKIQEIEIPLKNFAERGYSRLNSFMDQMIEKGIITEQQ